MPRIHPSFFAGALFALCLLSARECASTARASGGDLGDVVDELRRLRQTLEKCR